MASQNKSLETTKLLRKRKMRYYGLNNMILSNTTVYLNPYTENGSPLSVEEAAIYAAVSKYFNDGES
ncbi:hypothetical protein [Syntrophus aciditrophicus]|uniref:Hypothetical membrane protein n=1 Tax=Syntrophus aciditrophicus (strain SB) TaxID=56780 RepID=Q2LTF7_SYNAS|nr:hypothetical protein [Syntrophus aciditrophicus]ABC77364.1 hypothetical membrane protein [Syntrophus aciditrophicus SB]OPY19143.1 MAG: hypothetical protein A4E74_00254 [Syntrophus sp. PtaB.Bin075]